MNNLISRQAAIDYCYALINAENPSDPSDEWNYSQERINQTEVILHHLEFMPSAQLDRDIPIKPIETTDRAWGIPSKQAVCPKCDYYLGNVAFLGDYKGKRVTYCETCGQAIDWEGWEFDE